MEICRFLTMKNFKTLIITILVIILLSLNAQIATADATIDNGINYLKLKQGSSGKITGGSTGDASPWAAIAFGANGVDINTVKNPTASLKDYLLNNHPTNSSSVNEWEKWILAITATGFNPYNFGGVDYVTILKSAPYYNNNQIGDTAGVNDDWFGVMALISSGVNSSDTALNDTLSFIISHQHSDGGWGYAVDVDSDSNDTAASIQALVAAKNYGLTNPNLDNAINNAKTYLLSTQDPKTGGFLYDKMPWTTAPDSDSTTWALMALNVLGMKDSNEGNSARTWLLSQQSNSDGGFLAFDWGLSTYASNSTTTSHALIALVGKGWIVRIFTPPSTIVPSELSTLVASGVFTLPDGATSSSTQSIALSQQLVINIAGASGTNSATLPQGLIITRSDGAAIDIGALTIEETAAGSLSGLDSGVTAGGALQWGLPNLELSFSTPITISIYVGTALNGQTLSVVRSTSASGGWTSSGIVVPATCTVTLGYCSFQATKASYFAATQTSSSQSTSSSSSQSTTSSSIPTPTPTPSPTATPASSPRALRATPNLTKSPTGEVIGESTVASPAPEKLVKTSRQRNILLLVLAAASILGAGVYLWLNKKNR